MKKLRSLCWFTLSSALFWVSPPPALAEDVSPRTNENRPVPRTAAELQMVIDQTPDYGTVNCDRNQSLVVEKTIHVRKPITIRGLSARLPDKLGKTPLLVVETEGVVVTDFALRGNADTVDQSDRASLLEIHAGNFRVENGRFDNVAKNGLTIEPRQDEPRDVSGGIVRNLVGDGVVRDVVSISGGDGSAVVRNITVENIQGFRSKLRGAVEVSDGSQNITVRNVYAEESVYAVDIQDHGDPRQINSKVLLDNITAVRCRHAVRFSVHDFGHGDITLQNITAVENKRPLHLKHCRRLTLTNIRILGCREKSSPISLANCHGVILRDLFFETIPQASHLVEVDASSDHVLLDGLVSLGDVKNLKSAVDHERSSSNTAFVEVRNLLIGQSRKNDTDSNSAADLKTSEK